MEGFVFGWAIVRLLSSKIVWIIIILGILRYVVLPSELNKIAKKRADKARQEQILLMKEDSIQRQLLLKRNIE